LKINTKSQINAPKKTSLINYIVCDQLLEWRRSW